jgi:flavodoxin
MKPCLVIYYSRTGITRDVATRIATACACEIEPIRDTRPRLGWAGYLRSGREAFTRRTPSIAPMATNPADYGLLILGTPVWVGRLSAPMRSYIEANAALFPQVAAFCTMGGSGGDKVLDDIAALCGKPLVARLALADGEIKAGRDGNSIAEFVRATATASSQPAA